MWPARGGARAGSARAGWYSGMLRGLDVGSGSTWSATGSDLPPDTRFVGGLPEAVAHTNAGRRLSAEASTRDEARRARHTAGRTSGCAPAERTIARNL
jgi:hypothetical protein